MVETIPTKIKEFRESTNNTWQRYTKILHLLKSGWEALTNEPRKPRVYFFGVLKLRPKPLFNASSKVLVHATSIPFRVSIARGFGESDINVDAMPMLGMGLRTESLRLICHKMSDIWNVLYVGDDPTCRLKHHLIAEARTLIGLSRVIEPMRVALLIAWSRSSSLWSMIKQALGVC